MNTLVGYLLHEFVIFGVTFQYWMLFFAAIFIGSFVLLVALNKLDN